MATIHTTYLGNLRTEATHIQSANRLITDAPTDNNGKGEAFSPTDLLAASLGSCMLTIMGMAANTHNIDIKGTECSITKIMTANPRRVAEIHTEITFQSSFGDKQKAILEHAAITCPVYYSLHPDIKKVVSFKYS